MDLKTLKPKPSILNNIELYEPVDIEKAKNLINTKLVTVSDEWNEVKQLSRYIKNYDPKTKMVKVKYTRGELHEYGRVNPVNNLGIHTIRRKIRHTIAKDYLMDIDMVNAHPVILKQLCDIYGIKCDNLNKYVTDRETFINNIKEEYSVDRDEAKTLIIRLLYLGSYKKWLKEQNKENEIQFLNDFADEMKNISKFLIKNNPQLCNLLKTIKNKTKDSSIMAFYLQTIECYILEEIFNYCRREGIIKNICVLSNDGIMIPKDKYNDKLLSEFNKIIKDKFGLDIKFINKPMNEFYTDEEIKNNKCETERVDEFFQAMALSSHYDLAELFNENYESKDYIYNQKTGWYVYNNFNVIEHIGDKHPICLSNKITQTIQKILKEKHKQMEEVIQPDHPKFKKYNSTYSSVYKMVGNNSFKKGIIEELMKYYEKKDIEDIIDSNEKYIAFNDMLFDFTMKKYRPIEKNDYIMTTTGYNAPINKNEDIRDELRTIIKSIFENDKTEQFFFDSLGYSLFTNRFEKLHIWSGCGSNGKGLIMELLSLCYGSYFYVPDNQFLTTKYKADRANPSLYNTRNKKMVMVSEPENENDSDISFNIEFVKKITGRDEVTCRDLHKSNISFKPKFTLFLQCNEQPKLDKVEHAMARRILCLNFPFKFVENPKYENERKIDYNLKDKIKDPIYYTEFMGLLIDMIKDKINNTLNIPDYVKKATNEYMEDNNVVKHFIDAFLEVTNNRADIIPKTDLYKIYTQKGETTLTKTKFYYNMKQNNFNTKKLKGKEYFYGLKLRDENEIEDDQA